MEQPVPPPKIDIAKFPLLETFEIGAVVRIKPFKDKEEATKFLRKLRPRSMNPAFTPSMRYLAELGLSLKVLSKDGNQWYVCTVIAEHQSQVAGSNREWNLVTEWMYPSTWRSSIVPGAVTCTCVSLFHGCSCGGFNSEMKAKGRTWNKFLRSWNPE